MIFRLSPTGAAGITREDAPVAKKTDSGRSIRWDPRLNTEQLWKTQLLRYKLASIQPS